MMCSAPDCLASIGWLGCDDDPALKNWAITEGWKLFEGKGWMCPHHVAHAMTARTLAELLAKFKGYVMSPEEIEAQRQSWLRAFGPESKCEHGSLDWETCPGCREATP